MGLGTDILDTIAFHSCRNHHKLVEREDQSLSMPPVGFDTTREPCPLFNLRVCSYPRDVAICRAAGVKIIIIIVGNIRNAIGMIIFTGALCACSSAY